MALAEFSNPNIQLLVKDDGGMFQDRVVNGDAGADPTLAKLMGGAQADATQLASAEQTSSQIMVAIRDFPTLYNGLQPNVVWASPWGTNANGKATELITTAVSLPKLFEGAAATLGNQRRDTVHLELVMEATPGKQARVMTALGAPARGAGASTELLLGDTAFQVVATPTDDFGTPILVRGLVLGALLALGLVAAALMLQAANARYRARKLIEERESLLAARWSPITHSLPAGTLIGPKSVCDGVPRSVG